MRISLIILLIAVLIMIGQPVVAQTTKPVSETAKNPAAVELPENFPQSRYTPHGYLDNPYHSMVLNRSGVIRSLPPLGYGYWKREFFGSYGEGPRDHVNYLSFLQLSALIDSVSFIDPEDFTNNQIDLHSAYHTKNLMSYDWEFHQLKLQFQYFLPRENSLVCRVLLENLSDKNKSLTLFATNVYGKWEIKWWGSNGLTSRYLGDKDVSIGKIWAYGDILVLASDWQSSNQHAFFSRDEWENWIKNPGRESAVKETFRKGTGPVYSVQSFQIDIPAGGKKAGTIYLCRGANEQWTLNELAEISKEWTSRLQEKLLEDEIFWKKCPQLQGDWPLAWRHGWVYDWETLRMNVRRPIGIFKHPWDAMQVHSPRLVLGETALDMWAYGYADPDLAKEVIYGTFADALKPNIPCTREDGSVNMIGADGSECGTAPMWGFPYHVINAIYAETADSSWIRRLYPHLKAYIEWWLENRTDYHGWFHCNNSWESGQDGSRRFLVEGEGDPATFVRTVDVEASMAEAMKLMVAYAGIGGMTDDISYWRNLAETRIHNTRSMFFDGRFRDIDGRNNEPIIFEDYYDVMMLSPLTCGIATEEQISAIRKEIGYFLEKAERLQWPPGVFTFVEAAWMASEQLLAGEAIGNIADRVYRRTDQPHTLFNQDDDPFSYRIPGVANEFWPAGDRPAGGENYGWGAILPAHIIRHIFGFREINDKHLNAFFLAPALPERLINQGNTYQISNLKFRDLLFDVQYHVNSESELETTLTINSGSAFQITVRDKNDQILADRQLDKLPTPIRFSVRNGERYVIQYR